MTHRLPKLPLASRIIAAGCVAIWLAGVSACNLVALFCCDSHDRKTVAHAHPEHSHGTMAAEAGPNHAHDADAHHAAPDADQHLPDSHQPIGKEDLCCSTLIAVVPILKPVVFGKPDFHPISLLGVLVETPAASPAHSEIPPGRPAKNRDRVFTPEVCLGPANRSLAPPIFCLV